jgi:hypothetical protein
MTIKHKVFKLAELEVANWTKQKLFEKMGLNVTIDYALPQQWLDSFVKTSGLDYHLVLGTTFYAYSSELNMFGVPISGCFEVNQKLGDRGIEFELDTIFPIKYKIGDIIRFEGCRGLEREGKIRTIWTNPNGVPFADVAPVPLYIWEKKYDYSLIVCLSKNYIDHSYCIVVD